MAPSNPTIEVPYLSATVVVPDDAGAFGATRALYVGGQGGNMRVLMANGEDVVFNSVIPGTIYPLNVTRIFATNTTADNFLALR